MVTQVPPQIEYEEMDPIAVMVHQWLYRHIAPGITEITGMPLNEHSGIEISLVDLKRLILNCFDDIQSIMMASIRGPDEQLH